MAAPSSSTPRAIASRADTRARSSPRRFRRAHRATSTRRSSSVRRSSASAGPERFCPGAALVAVGAGVTTALRLVVAVAATVAGSYGAIAGLLTAS
jgi:hypothetical protein